MRDDLHKTVSLTPRWRGVVRAVCQRHGDDEIARKIVCAAQADVTLDERIGNQTIGQVLRGLHPDLLGNDEANMRRCLLAAIDSPISLAARRICEIALGVLSTEGCGQGFVKKVETEARAAYARDEIELVAARVANEYGVREAEPLLRKLRQVLTTCNFDEPAATTRVKKSHAEVIDMHLDLTVEEA